MYGGESSVVTVEMLKVLGGFQHWVSRLIVVMTAQHTEDGEWEYSPVADALESEGIYLIKEYIKRQ